MQGALGHRPVAEEGDGDAAGAAHLMGEGAAGGDGQARADDAVGAQHADAHVGDVHRAATAAAYALGPAHDFEEEPLEVETFGQRVAVPAMIGGKGVFEAQRGAHADRHRLLPDAEMDEARHLAVGEHLRQPLFGPPHDQHAPVKLQEFNVAVGGGRGVPAFCIPGHLPSQFLWFAGRADVPRSSGVRGLLAQLERPRQHRLLMRAIGKIYGNAERAK